MTDFAPAGPPESTTGPAPAERSGVPPAAPGGAAASSGVLLLPVPELPFEDEAGSPQLTLALRTAAGETVAEGFTTPDRLVDACGPAQPWVALSVADSIRLLAGAGASVLVVDPGVDGGAVGLDLRCVRPDARGARR